MKVRSAKAKGRMFEAWLRRHLERALGLSKDELSLQGSGAQGIDIWPTPSAKKWFPFAVEAKNRERLNIFTAWDQATNNAERGDLEPLVIAKRGGYTLAVLDLDYFLSLISGNPVDVTKTLMKIRRERAPFKEARVG